MTELAQLHAAMREGAREHLGAYAEDERKVARIALCAAVQLFAACHQTRRDAHLCLDHAFDTATGGQSVLTAMAKMEAALALVGNADGVSLEVAAERGPFAAAHNWEEWREA